MDYNTPMNFGGCKGIMLCDRPFEAVHTRESKASNIESGIAEGSFICGTVKRPWGCNVTIPEKTKVLNRLSQKNGILSKHKKWLSDLQKKRDEKTKEQLKQKEEKENRKVSFMARAARKRALARDKLETLPKEQLDDNQVEDYHNHLQNDESLNEELHILNRQESNDNISDDSNCSHSVVNRPAWSLTENTANICDRVKENIEEENLLHFVQGLDYEKYSKDAELKCLIDQVKRRIESLEKEKLSDEKRLHIVEEVQEEKERARRYEENVSLDELLEANSHENNENDISSIANSAKSEQSIRTVHSKKSMSALISKAKEKIVAMEPIIEDPLQFTLVEDEGRRLAETKSLNKLPFKNRNPAL